MIIAAAIRTSEGCIHFFPKPHRHHHIIHALHRPRLDVEIDLIEAKGEQGFITNEGNFVSREIAAEIAISSKQIEKLKWPPKLYSEDLW